MFYDVKSPGLKTNLGTMLSYHKLKNAPPLNLDIDKENMSAADYAEIIGDKAIPLDMMEVSCPFECFLENAPAFCKPIEGEGEKHQSVCDLGYLDKVRSSSEGSRQSR